MAMAAAAAALLSWPKSRSSLPSSHQIHHAKSQFPIPQTPRFFPSHLNTTTTLPSPPNPVLSTTPHASSTATSPVATAFHGACYVVGDNIDTDQIIPAEHLTLVPSKPDEYRKLGSFALVGLPSSSYPTPFVDPGSSTTRFPIIVGGSNFGCGSSREHAPVALGASGVKAVVAESYARIFFRNSVATGEIYPVESEDVGLCKECSTGDILTVDLSENKVINHTTRKMYSLKPIGDAGPVVEAGGIFAYARKTGMIPSASTA